MTMLPEPLPPRLSCPWRAGVIAAVVRSTMSVPSATFGAVQLAARLLATSSLAAMPSWAPALGRSEAQYVALRIDTLIYLIDLTLYPAIPLGWHDL